MAGKVHFSKTIDDLAQYIDRDRIPTELDGAEQYKYSYIEPTPDESALMRDIPTRDSIQSERDQLIRQYEEATRTWLAAGDNGAPASNAGPPLSVAGDGTDGEAVDGKEEGRGRATQLRQRIAGDLSRNYWRLDPYVRARGLYDRLGMLGPGGVLKL